MVSWQRLIRFSPPDEEIVYFGEPIGTLSELEDIGAAVALGRLGAAVIEVDETGPLSNTARVTERIVTVGRLLAPLTLHECHDIKCIGLNYRKHIQEAGRSLPPYPSLFIKPTTALTGYNDEVVIPKIAQEGEADYEGELCVVIGSDCKDVSEADAMSYVAGYTCGDDVSTRKWQRNKERAGGVPQWCFSKGFDRFAPLGPMIVSTSLIPDPSELQMEVKVNGETRQATSISDLVFDVPTLVSFLSQGTTLRRGTVIMTGTPGGVGCTGPEDQWKPLMDGDEVEVIIKPIGTLRHSVKYA